MQISGAFPSEYLRAADLQGKQVRVVIDNVELREVGGDGEHKPVLFFQGRDKGVVLNKTNATVLAEAYGDDTDDWTGETVVLFEALVSFQGKNVKAIRMRVPTPAERKKSAARGKPTESENPAPDVDDEIPF